MNNVESIVKKKLPDYCNGKSDFIRKPETDGHRWRPGGTNWSIDLGQYKPQWKLSKLEFIRNLRVAARKNSIE